MELSGQSKPSHSEHAWGGVFKERELVPVVRAPLGGVLRVPQQAATRVELQGVARVPGGHGVHWGRGRGGGPLRYRQPSSMWKAFVSASVSHLRTMGSKGKFTGHM
jgi:hypothetical protein